MRHLTLTELANAEIQLAQARDQMQNSAKQLELLPGRFIEGNLGSTGAGRTAAGVAGTAALYHCRFRVRLRATDYQVKSAKKPLLPRITLTADSGIGSHQGYF